MPVVNRHVGGLEILTNLAHKILEVNRHYQRTADAKKLNELERQHLLEIAASRPEYATVNRVIKKGELSKNGSKQLEAIIANPKLDSVEYNELKIILAKRQLNTIHKANLHAIAAN